LLRALQINSAGTLGGGLEIGGASISVTDVHSNSTFSNLTATKKKATKRIDTPTNGQWLFLVAG